MKYLSRQCLYSLPALLVGLGLSAPSIADLCVIGTALVKPASTHINPKEAVVLEHRLPDDSEDGNGYVVQGQWLWLLDTQTPQGRTHSLDLKDIYNSDVSPPVIDDGYFLQTRHANCNWAEVNFRGKDFSSEFDCPSVEDFKKFCLDQDRFQNRNNNFFDYFGFHDFSNRDNHTFWTKDGAPFSMTQQHVGYCIEGAKATDLTTTHNPFIWPARIAAGNISPDLRGIPNAIVFDAVGSGDPSTETMQLFERNGVNIDVQTHFSSGNVVFFGAGILVPDVENKQIWLSVERGCDGPFRAGDSNGGQCDFRVKAELESGPWLPSENTELRQRYDIDLKLSLRTDNCQVPLKLIANNTGSLANQHGLCGDSILGYCEKREIPLRLTVGPPILEVHVDGIKCDDASCSLNFSPNAEGPQTKYIVLNNADRAIDNLNLTSFGRAIVSGGGSLDDSEFELAPNSDQACYGADLGAGRKCEIKVTYRPERLSGFDPKERSVIVSKITPVPNVQSIKIRTSDPVRPEILLYLRVKDPVLPGMPEKE